MKSRIPSGYEMKQMRVQADLTQNELAKRAGLSQALIARLEAGTIDPRLSTLKIVIQAIEEAEAEKVKAKDKMVSPVKTVNADETVARAIEIIRSNNISQVPVMSMGVPIGLISEKDIVARIEDIDDPAEREQLKRTPVTEMMNDAPPIVNPNTNLSAVSQMLAYSSVVLVCEKGRLKGIIARSDVLGD